MLSQGYISHIYNHVYRNRVVLSRSVKRYILLRKAVGVAWIMFWRHSRWQTLERDAQQSEILIWMPDIQFQLLSDKAD